MFGFLKELGLRSSDKRHPGREIIINVEKLEIRVAVLEKGRLEEFQVEHPSKERFTGSIYKGRIQNLENDLQAAFVDIGVRKSAFLHYWNMNPNDDSILDDEDGNHSENNNQRRKPRANRFTNEEIAAEHPIGSIVTVQVSKGPIGTKGPRVTASLSIPGRYVVFTPGCPRRGVSRKISDLKERARLKGILEKLSKLIPKDCGMIIRTAGMGCKRSEIFNDLRAVLSSYDEMKKAIAEQPAPCCVYEEPDLIMRVVRDYVTKDIDRIVVDDPIVYEQVKKEVNKIFRHRSRNVVQLYEDNLPIFDRYGVEKLLEEAFRRKIILPSGGYLIIDETEALIAVDVNTGRHKGKGSQEDTVFEVNLEAATEIARQLRLRNIGGLVVLDLIDMKSRKHKQQVYKTFKTALKQRDRAHSNVLEISGLGLLEMTRQRVDEGLLSQTHQECPYCHGKGKIKSPFQISIDVQRRLRSITGMLKSENRETDLQVCIHPSVLERLRTEDETLVREIQDQYNGRLSFKSDPLRQAESFSIADVKTGQILFSTGEPNPV